MSTAVTVPAETGEPYCVARTGPNRVTITRRSESGFEHRLTFRTSEALAVINVVADLLEQTTI
ncbi:hypothetical protein [Mycolicibacterium palauense]|uniref:hypothetical protein n=1 Tax=Mycolicibacterium palauense TaxID=2034511 RepID=UPI000BFEE8AF|nr:hypothetical protein [Mycolicibacterium palauense]